MEASPCTQPRTDFPTTMFEELPAMTPATCGSWRATPSCNGKRLPDDSFIDVTPKDLRIPYWPLLWEGQGGFWGSDPAGIHCFRKGRFVTYPLPHWLSRLRITSAAEERNGTIWLETSDGKHARITNGNVEAVNANTPGKNAIVDFRDRGGNLW